MNNQPIEKLIYREKGDLEVHSVFFTIQGEGPLAGKRAVFVRLAGCNLQCPGCDTDYTSTRTWMSPRELLNRIYEVVPETAKFPFYNELHVVITGGEPFRQNLIPFLREVDKQPRVVRLTVQIETNGTLFDPGYVEFFRQMASPPMVVCSPKTGRINHDLEPFVHSYKYVVKAGDIDPRDGLPMHALDHPCINAGVARPAYIGRHIFIQPMDEKSEEANRNNIETAVEVVLNHGYNLCIQTHKIVGVE